MDLLVPILYSLGLMIIICFAVFNWLLHQEMHRLFLRLNVLLPRPLRILSTANVYLPLITATLLIILFAIWR